MSQKFTQRDYFHLFSLLNVSNVILDDVHFEEGTDTDYVMCITDRLIQNEAEGLTLAKAVHDITDIPLQRISFWHHARDDSLQEYQINYRKRYMIDVIDKFP